MNWCELGTVCAAVPLLCCVKVTYGRADLDALEEQVVIIEPPDNPSTQREHAHKDNGTRLNDTYDTDMFADQSVDLYDKHIHSNSVSGRRSTEFCSEPDVTGRISGQHSAGSRLLTT